MTFLGNMALMTRPTTGRALAGVLARLIVDSSGTVVAAEQKTGISRSNLYRIFDADPTVTRVLYRRFESGFGLPPFLFDHVMDVDSEWVAARDMEPQLKAFITESLADILAANSSAATRQRRTRRGA